MMGGFGKSWRASGKWGTHRFLTCSQGCRERAIGQSMPGALLEGQNRNRSIRDLAHQGDVLSRTCCVLIMSWSALDNCAASLSASSNVGSVWAGTSALALANPLTSGAALAMMRQGLTKGLGLNEKRKRLLILTRDSEEGVAFLRTPVRSKRLGYWQPMGGNRRQQLFLRCATMARLTDFRATLTRAP
jgi:hypothetical protein